MTASFFEGPEKKVELVVQPGFPSLRTLEPNIWEQVVHSAEARIISCRQNSECIAYLLSESSLFVFDDYVVMITCGQTNLVDAIESMLKVIPSSSIALLTYERKNEYFPAHQRTSFADDAIRLALLLDGEAIRFGGENGHCIHLFHTTKAYTPMSDDPTLEVLMHGIDENVAQQFETGSLPKDGLLADKVGISSILPGFTIDEYAFSPAGYSLNAVDGDRYYAIHVTPERLGSYVSFETNHDFRSDLTPLLRRIVEVFRPRSFDILSFSPEQGTVPEIGGYVVTDHVEHPVCGYTVTFLQYGQPVSGSRAAHKFVLQQS